MSTPKKASLFGIFIVMLGALFYCYEYFLRIAPSVMQPDLLQYFTIDATLFGTLIGFYYYAYTPMQLIVGVLLDRYNTRNVLTFAILSCAVGSYLFATTHSFEVAAIGRFLQGFGSAFAFVGALKLASRWLPIWWFASFSGVCTTLGFLGGATGDIFLTRVVQQIGWQRLIHVFVILGLLFALIFWLCNAIKLKNAVTFDHVKSPPLTLKAAFIQLLMLFKQPYLWCAGILGGLLFLPTIVFADLWGIPYLQEAHGYSLTNAGLACSMIYFGWALGSPFQGIISNLINRRLQVIFIGSLLATVTSIAVLYLPSLHFIVVCILFLLLGIFSSVQCLTFAMGADVCTAQTTAMTMAFINFFVMLSGIFMQSGVGMLLDLNWSGMMQNDVRYYSVSDYQHTMVIVPASLLLAAVIAFFIKDKKLRLK